jgi:hypothetical protein
MLRPWQMWLYGRRYIDLANLHLDVADNMNDRAEAEEKSAAKFGFGKWEAV